MSLTDRFRQFAVECSTGAKVELYFFQFVQMGLAAPADDRAEHKALPTVLSGWFNMVQMLRLLLMGPKPCDKTTPAPVVTTTHPPEEHTIDSNANQFAAVNPNVMFDNIGDFGLMDINTFIQPDLSFPAPDSSGHFSLDTSISSIGSDFSFSENK